MLLGLILPALALAPVVASGEGAEPAAAVKRSRTNADVARSNREYRATCAQGNTKISAHDVDGAIALYKKAIEIAPNVGLAYYLLGEAQVSSGNLQDAAASYSRALDASGADAALHARVLFVTADLKERQKKPDEAKTAWQAYSEWATQHPDAGAFPASALSRQQVIDAVIAQDKTTNAVRERIAATEDGGVFSDPARSPPSK